MASPEVNVEVVVPETTTETETSGAPEVVVVETAAPSGGTDPAAVLTMEIIHAQLTEARSEIASLKSEVSFLREWQSAQSQRIGELEEVEEVEGVEGAEVVAEVVPAAVVETPVETEPKKRKRSFV